MRLARFDDNRLGLVEGATVRDVTAALDVLPPARYPFPTHDLFSAHLDEVAARARALAPSAPALALDAVRLLSPVANPGKLVAAPVNYEKHLAEVKSDASLHQNTASHTLTIHKAGVFLKATSSLVGAGEVHATGIRATTDAAELPACEFGIVATKAMHTAAASAATAHAFADGAVASVQNGVGNEEEIAPHVARVIRSTTFPAGKILEPGVVQWDVKGDTTFGPFEPSPARREEIERLADACTRGGMPTRAVDDARGAQWRKVIFNASTNPVGALTGLTHGRVCERPDLRALVSALSRLTREPHKVIHARVTRDTGAASVTAASAAQLEQGNALLEREAARRR